jgi:hypothetical protein
MRFTRLKGFLLACMTAFAAAAAEEWTLRGDPAPWRVRAAMEGAKDVSGASLGAPGSGLLVSDETRVAQVIELDRESRTVMAGATLPLLAGKGKELDLEGITASSDGQWFYATGSHAFSRKGGTARQHVFRFSARGLSKLPDVATLIPVLESESRLRDCLGKSSDEGGVDIEGIAERGGTLFFGLRSPSVAGHALVIEVKAGELFSKAGRASHRTHELALGEGRGIRDLARTNEGFLLIAGSSGGGGDGAGGFSLHFWAGPEGALSRAGTLPDAAGKPEALTVLDEDASSMSVLVWFDGATSGAPLEIRLSKRGG